MKLIRDETAQAGGIFMFIFGILVVGLLYAMLSIVIDTFWSTNNDLINTPGMHYSTDHYNTMDILFQFWWAVPIVAILIFVIYAVKNALAKSASQV